MFLEADGLLLGEMTSVMARGLDHIVHAVRDLDAAADFYRRLGFIVGRAIAIRGARTIISCNCRGSSSRS